MHRQSAVAVAEVLRTTIDPCRLSHIGTQISRNSLVLRSVVQKRLLWAFLSVNSGQRNRKTSGTDTCPPLVARDDTLPVRCLSDGASRIQFDRLRSDSLGTFHVTFADTKI